MNPRLALAAAAAALLAAAGSSCAHRKAASGAPAAVVLQDSGDDPASIRRGFGNERLHTWWPLTAPEQAALAGLPEARRGDARALLALAILASGDVRDAQGAARIQQRVDAFVAAIKPVIERAPDDWHRGYELHRAMHRTFFTGGGDLQGYRVDQPRLTGIFSTGTYNCLSSTLLFVVLARAFDLPVRGVAVPSHVFVEMGAPGTRPIEVETTSSRGFGLVHDARFFQQQSGAWASQRGLPPLTFEDYQRRSILSPTALLGMAMINVRPAESEDDTLRLFELAALVDPDNVELQHNRLAAYSNEANRLMEAKAMRTMARLFDVVSPALADLGARVRTAELARLLSWLRWYHGHALSVVGRRDQARAIMDAGIERIDPAWSDAELLRNNYLSLLVRLFGERIDAKDFAGAEAIAMAHRAVCLADDVCHGNLGILYLNWAAEQYNAGHRPAARQVLQTCVANVPGAKACREQLLELESQHRL